MHFLRMYMYIYLTTTTCTNNMQVPSSDFPTRELFRGKQVASLKSNNNGSKGAGEADQANDITLMIFWQVKNLNSVTCSTYSISKGKSIYMYFW